MVACGCIFHMPSEGDLYRCTSWFGSCSSLCIAPGELDRAQLLPVGSSSPSQSTGGGTGAELVGNAGMEKTLPAGKATRREGVGARRISERCLEGGWAGSEGWHGGSWACKEAKTQCKYLPAALPAPGTHVPRSRPRCPPGQEQVTVKHVSNQRLKKPD